MATTARGEGPEELLTAIGEAVAAPAEEPVDLQLKALVPALDANAAP